MRPINPQADYFDKKNHRLHDTEVIHPTTYHQWELQHLQQKLGTIGTSIIDFGAGNGRVSFWFLKQGYDVTAVDVSEQSLKELHSIYNRHKKPTWGKLTTLTAIPKGKTFDAVVGADVLHHVDIPFYLHQFHRSLKPGGRLAFSEPNGMYLPWYAFIAAQRLPWSIEKGIIRIRTGYLSRQLNLAGFSDIRLTGHGLLPTMLLFPFPAMGKINAHIWGNNPFKSFMSFRLIITSAA